MEMLSICRAILLLYYIIATLKITRGQHVQHIGTNDHEGKLYNVSVTCGRDSLVVKVHSRRPFVGRLYVRDHYRDPNCSVLGDGGKSVSLTLKYHGSTCGLNNMGNGTLATKVVIQRHPRIMLREDESYRVLCYFKIDSRTVVSKTLDVRGELPASSLTEKAPRVRLRIMDMSGNDVTTAKMGDDLILLIELVDSSAYGIMARDLVISSPAEANSITLLDSNGCIQEPSVFPQLASHPPSKDLVGRFKAFRFPNDPVIRFRVTVRFCWNYCRPVLCPHNTDFGYGRKRRAANRDHGLLHLGRSNIISRALPKDITLEMAMVIEDRDPKPDDLSGNHLFKKPEVLFHPPERNELHGRAPVFPTSDRALMLPAFRPAPSIGSQVHHRSSSRLVPLRHREYDPQSLGDNEFVVLSRKLEILQ